MRRKTLLGIAVSLAALACAAQSPENAAEPCCEQMEIVGIAAEPDGVVMTVEQTEWDSAAAMQTDSRELSRKAKQQEKARNAAENDSWGGAITLIAMCIVISALAILSILFMCFGKVSTYLQKSRKRKAHGVTVSTSEEHHEELDSGEAIAAISMALAEHMGQGHDIEDTILTIRRMRKAYSPWNSKIYNLRVVPEHTEARKHRGL